MDCPGNLKHLIAPDAEIELTAQIRNLKQAPLTVLRPFGDGYHTLTSELKIWNENGRIQYSGPKWDYDVRKEGFSVIAPGKQIEHKIKLSSVDFSGLEASGRYTLRYDYSYHGLWDPTAGIDNAWRGTVSSREIHITRK